MSLRTKTKAPAPDRSLARHVGRVLATARGDETRAAVVSRIGWGSPVNLLRLETGEDNPTLDRLQRVAAALGGHLEVRFVPGRTESE